MDIEDRSLDYLSAQLKLRDRRELTSQQKSGIIKIKDPADVLALKDDIVDKQIDNLRTNDQVKYSVIELSFYQSNSILTEIIANDDPSAYDPPVFKRLGLAFVNGWNVFMDVLIGLVNLWVFLLAGAAIWFVVKHYKKWFKLSHKPV